MNKPIITTPRLILRQWHEDDFAPFAALNGDPEVMRFFPATLTRDESDSLAARFQDGIEERGWGFWAVESRENGEFVGCVGLHPQPDRFAFSPCTEIGWRLDKRFWHQGLATGAAQVCLDYAFVQLALAEVVSFTSVLNVPSQSLMKRLGMEKRGEFAHPALTTRDRLSQHVLYGKTRPA